MLVVGSELVVAMELSVDFVADSVARSNSAIGGSTRFGRGAEWAPPLRTSLVVVVELETVVGLLELEIARVASVVAIDS